MLSRLVFLGVHSWIVYTIMFVRIMSLQGNTVENVIMTVKSISLLGTRADSGSKLACTRNFGEERNQILEYITKSKLLYIVTYKGQNNN